TGGIELCLTRAQSIIRSPTKEGMTMRAAQWTVCGAAAVLAMSAPAAFGGQLKVVNVAGPGVNCGFHIDCKITLTDTIGNVPPGNLAMPGTARLQSRTFTGAAGTPGNGKTGYDYRLDMTQASGSLECLAGIVVNFGPVAQLPYSNNLPADVYVVTQGG